ncbi:hypothetical protein DFH09DRAFT_1405753 [Mycena vulgaris]|nr:hypothetical protein DFH09DRAFT_1405753 [Mycena vulgaris]
MDARPLCRGPLLSIAHAKLEEASAPYAGSENEDRQQEEQEEGAKSVRERAGKRERQESRTETQEFEEERQVHSEQIKPSPSQLGPSRIPVIGKEGSLASSDHADSASVDGIKPDDVEDGGPPCLVRRRLRLRPDSDLGRAGRGAQGAGGRGWTGRTTRGAEGAEGGNGIEKDVKKSGRRGVGTERWKARTKSTRNRDKNRKEDEKSKARTGTRSENRKRKRNRKRGAKGGLRARGAHRDERLQVEAGRLVEQSSSQRHEARAAYFSLDSGAEAVSGALCEVTSQNRRRYVRMRESYLSISDSRIAAESVPSALGIWVSTLRATSMARTSASCVKLRASDSTANTFAGRTLRRRSFIFGRMHLGNESESGTLCAKKGDRTSQLQMAPPPPAAAHAPAPSPAHAFCLK